MLFPVHLLVLKCTLQDLWRIILFNVYIAGILGGGLFFIWEGGVFKGCLSWMQKQKITWEKDTYIYIHVCMYITEAWIDIFFKKNTEYVWLYEFLRIKAVDISVWRSGFSG